MSVNPDEMLKHRVNQEPFNEDPAQREVVIWDDPLLKTPCETSSLLLPSKDAVFNEQLRIGVVRVIKEEVENIKRHDDRPGQHNNAPGKDK